ncbi:MAG: metallophosphoesterase family protein, partial [Promethearchaeota archaeon]
MEMSDFEPRGDLYNENVFPAIVRPNFGQPEIISPLNFKFELTENKVSDTEFMRRGVLPEYIDYAFMGLIACNRRIRVDEIFNELDKNLYLYPLSERIVNGRALRMEPIHIKTKELYPIRILRIDDPDYNGHPQEYLKTEDVFGKRDRYFFVKFTIKVPSSIFLKKEPESSTKFDEDNLEGADSLLKKFILCDIVYDLKPKCPFSIDLCDRNYSKYFKNETELMDCQNKESAGQIQDKEKEQENTQGKEQENAKGKEQENAQGKGQEKEKGGSGGQETEEQELKYINYHSIVLTLRDKEEINDLNLFVATDLHVSERNDEMFPIIFKGLQKDGKRKEQLEKYYKNKEKFEKYFMNNYNPDDPDYDVVKSINDRLKSPYIFAYKIEPPYIKPFNNTTVATEKNIDFEDDDFFWNLPIEYRIQNPNNNLRMFIYEANEAYKKNQLDLVIFLGDLVDYVSPKDADDFEYENSNWKLFQDILLGKAYKKKIPGCLPPEEILVPIYTIPGNHDYRGHIYPVTYKNKIFGLTNKEVKYYSDVSILSSFKAIYANIKFLRGYFQFINPDLNYAKKIGKTHLI